jgi:transcriptional regulator with PAS, ATPase and Fis domain
MKSLISHSYPGNVRELENLVQRAVILAGDDDKLTVNHLQADWEQATKEAILPGIAIENKSLPAIIEEFEIKFISEILNFNKGNISKTAKDLGLSRAGLYKKIKRYNLG